MYRVKVLGYICSQVLSTWTMHPHTSKATGKCASLQKRSLLMPTQSQAHLEDPIEVPFVHTQEVAVVFAEDNGGCPRGIVYQCQLPKVIAVMEGAH